MFLGDGQAEDADPGQFLDQRQWYQPVLAMPFLGNGCDRALGKAAHLIADHVEGRVVETDRPEPGCAAVGDQRAQPRAGSGQPCDQFPGFARAQRRGFAFGEAQLGRTGEFALRHRDAAGELSEIFAIGGFEDQGLGFAERAGAVEPQCPVADLAQTFDRRCDPGEARARQTAAPRSAPVR